MTMSLTQQAITLLMVVLGTLITRFLPFIVFPAGKPTPISRKGSPLGSFRTSCSILSEKYRYYQQKSRFAGVYFHCIYHLPPFMEKKYTALNCSRNDLLYAACSVCILKKAPLSDNPVR